MKEKKKRIYITDEYLMKKGLLHIAQISPDVANELSDFIGHEKLLEVIEFCKENEILK